MEGKSSLLHRYGLELFLARALEIAVDDRHRVASCARYEMGVSAGAEVGLYVFAAAGVGEGDVIILRDDERADIVVIMGLVVLARLCTDGILIADVEEPLRLTEDMALRLLDCARELRICPKHVLKPARRIARSCDRGDLHLGIDVLEKMRQPSRGRIG